MAAIDGREDLTKRLMSGGIGWMYWAGGLALIALSLAVIVYGPADQEFPDQALGLLNFADWVNQGEVWLRENYRWFTRTISGAVGWAFEHLENFLLLQPWPVVTLAIVLPALVYGGIRLALFCLIGVMFWGAVDMWDSAMETLALMTVAVVLSVFFGVLIGIACAQSDRVEAVVRPVLDLMQTMPAFVYLIPAIFFFGVGAPPAIMATMIYAMPPAVRLTNLGIRQVPYETIEAARSFGSTRLQMLYKVQLPLATPSIMMGINQTVMMALGLAVLAALIGARGLGYEVWQSMRQLQVGWSLEAGACIVFMAIIFDRLSTAMAQANVQVAADRFRLLPNFLKNESVAREFEADLGVFCGWVTKACQAWTEFWARIAALVVGIFNRSLAEGLFGLITRHPFFVSGICLIWAVMLFDQHVASIGGYPRDWQFTLRGPVDRAVDALTIDKTFIAITKGIRTILYLYLLNPLNTFLISMPWWYTIAISSLLIWFSAGRNLALVTLVSLVLIGSVGLWDTSMETLAVILVSVLVCLIVGVPIGVMTAYNDTFNAILKPVLDTMQTLPTFVYLIPVIMFFGGNVVSALIATVIYALPPMIRLTGLGIRQVPPQAEEVARSFGSTGIQILRKIKLPLSLPSIMLGVNQAIMMALAMTVVTPLIGGKGLGKEVYDAMNIANPGKGLQAGIAIVLMAVLLDRLTQVWSRKQREALGL